MWGRCVCKEETLWEPFRPTLAVSPAQHCREGCPGDPQRPGLEHGVRRSGPAAVVIQSHRLQPAPDKPLVSSEKCSSCKLGS